MEIHGLGSADGKSVEGTYFCRQRSTTSLINRHITPEVAELWRGAGINAGDTGSWVSAGFVLDAAVAWKQVGIAPGEAVAWRQNGFDPNEAKGWREQALDASTAGKWKIAGFTPAKSKAWRDVGADVASIGSCGRGGRRPDQVIQEFKKRPFFKKRGLDKEQMLFYCARNMSARDAENYEIKNAQDAAKNAKETAR